MERFQLLLAFPARAVFKICNFSIIVYEVAPHLINVAHLGLGITYCSLLNFAGLSPNRTQSGRNPIGQQHLSGQIVG